MFAIENDDTRTMSARTQDKRFLFAHWEGGGNTPPVVAIVKRLTAAGHQVHAVSDPCNRDDFEPAGATFSSWKRPHVRHTRTAESDPLRDWEVKSPPQLLARLRDRIFVGPALAYAQDTLDALERNPSDVIATSEMLLGSMLAGERLGIPTVAISPNICLHPLPGVPPFGPGLLPARNVLERLRDKAVGGMTRFIFGRTAHVYNETRRTLGLAPIAHPLDQLHRVDRQLILTSPAFDFPATKLPKHIVYTGPELADPVWTRDWTDPRPANDTRPLVLVGFSTTYQQQTETLQRVIHSLRDLPVTAIVTAGPALSARAFEPAPNVHIVPSAPHSVLLKEAALVITHAGHGTVIRSLAAGVPLLCMPMGRDQNDNAARVFHHGAGLRLAPTAETAAIRASVQALLNNPKYKQTAQSLGRKIAEDAANSPATGILEELAAKVRS